MATCMSDQLVCVECGTEQKPNGVSHPSDTVECIECGYTSNAVMFDPHEILE